MIAKIALYAILFDKRINSHKILSDHPEEFVETNARIKPNIDFFTQFIELFGEYFDFDYKYVRPVILDPMIDADSVTIPVYCLIPYSAVPKQGYLIEAKRYANTVPAIRKILNLT